MKKRTILAFCSLLAAMLFVTGCGNGKSSKEETTDETSETTVTYSTIAAYRTESSTFCVEGSETDDTIKIQLNIEDGYDLLSDTAYGTFTITKDGEELSYGQFLPMSFYALDAPSEKYSNIQILNEGTKSNCSYVMWRDDGDGSECPEYNYIVKIDGADSYFILRNSISEASAKECFDRLEITGIKVKKSTNFSLDNDETVKIGMTLTGGYSLTPYAVNRTFTITKDGEELSQGMLINSEYNSEYQDAYVDIDENDGNTEVIDKGTKSGFSYVARRTNDSKNPEYSYVITIDETNTVLLIMKDVSEDSAKECFDRLDFEILDN